MDQTAVKIDWNAKTVSKFLRDKNILVAERNPDWCPVCSIPAKVSGADRFCPCCGETSYWCS